MGTPSIDINKMETQLAQWGTKLKELVASAAKKSNTDLTHRVDDLKAKHATAQTKWTEFKAAGVDKWDTYRKGVEAAWHDVEAAVTKASN